MPGRVVWVLGSGFSRHLGGPLLKDLLSPAALAEVDDCYEKSTPDGVLRQAVVRLFNSGIERKLWQDAEEFLDILDTAASTSAGEATLTPMISDLQPAGLTLAKLQEAARKFIAAQCCSFLERNLHATERWLPYERWATELLRSDDCVVSFNYDCLLEKLNERVLAERAKDPAPGSDQHVLRVVDSGTLRDPNINCAKVLKLHGSTSWRRKMDKSTSRHVVKTGQWDHAIGCPHEELVIATPGPGKSEMAGILSDFWMWAAEEIERADAIVFMGYRFPPSDSKALSMFTQVIAKNTTVNLRLHTVLGSSASDDAVRLKQLLEFACTARPEYRKKGDWTEQVDSKVVPHRLFTQDFMTVALRSTLLGPAQAGFRTTGNVPGAEPARVPE